ncbi:hypothetical protein BGZ65_012500, partial [Modicella reniformis]
SSRHCTPQKMPRPWSSIISRAVKWRERTPPPRIFECAIKVFTKRSQSKKVVDSQQLNFPHGSTSTASVMTSLPETPMYEDLLGRFSNIREHFSDKKQQRLGRDLDVDASQNAKSFNPYRTVDKGRARCPLHQSGNKYKYRKRYSFKTRTRLVEHPQPDTMRIQRICQRAIIAVYMERISDTCVDENDRKVLDKLCPRISDKDILDEEDDGDAQNESADLTDGNVKKDSSTAFLSAFLNCIYNRRQSTRSEPLIVAHFIDKVEDVLPPMSDPRATREPMSYPAYTVLRSTVTELSAALRRHFKNGSRELAEKEPEHLITKLLTDIDSYGEEQSQKEAGLWAQDF